MNNKQNNKIEETIFSLEETKNITLLLRESDEALPLPSKEAFLSLLNKPSIKLYPSPFRVFRKVPMVVALGIAGIAFITVFPFQSTSTPINEYADTIVSTAVAHASAEATANEAVATSDATQLQLTEEDFSSLAPYENY